MPDPIEVSVVIGGITYRGTLQPDAVTPPSPPPDPVRKTFSIFTGANIPPQYPTELALSGVLKGLCPWSDANLEWWVKAGEGGSWEGEWDPHPLSIGSPQDLIARRDVLAHLGVRVVPWVNLRGRAEWEVGEHEIIQQCASICGAVGLNLEPGLSFWNGPTTPGGVAEWIDRLGLGPDLLWLVAIPRTTSVFELGGQATMVTWLEKVGGASWECYDATAADLNPDLALPRVNLWDLSGNPWKRIPIVQKSRISHWASSHWAEMAMQVWELGGD